MFKKLMLIALIAGVSQAAYSQSEPDTKEKERKGRPDIPGTFIIDFGLNFPSNNDVGFNTGTWGSRTLNLYYQHDKRIGQSQFSVHPGLGFGLERYKFNNEKTLAYIPGPTSPFDNLRMVQGPEGTKKSQLVANYFDILIEVRFSSLPNDPARSFKGSVGFKGGVLMDSFTKLKYSEDGETKKIKDKQDWNVTQWRYGLIGRLGLGNISLWGYYSLSEIFEKGKGPDQAALNTWTFGVSLGGF